ncbi:hypothetical protein T484DRAFT_1866277, partial [Baffinella frigidus]
VSKEKAASVTAAATSENLNAALASSGISFQGVSAAITLALVSPTDPAGDGGGKVGEVPVDASAPEGDAGLTGVVAGVAVGLLALLVGIVKYRARLVELRASTAGAWRARWARLVELRASTAGAWRARPPHPLPGNAPDDTPPLAGVGVAGL